MTESGAKYKDQDRKVAVKSGWDAVAGGRPTWRESAIALLVEGKELLLLIRGCKESERRVKWSWYWAAKHLPGGC